MEYGSSNLDKREEQDFINAFALADNIVMRSYINRIGELEVREPEEAFLKKEAGTELRMFRIDKIIYDADENNIQKLTNLYNMAYSQNLNLFMLLNSDGKEVELYLGICEEEKKSRLQLGIEALYNGFVGNFPGSLDKLERIQLEKSKCEEVIHRCLGIKEKKAVSVVSGVASGRGEKISENNKFIQGIEKMIDSMKGVPFSAITIANPIEKRELLELRNELETLYTALKPFEKTATNVSESHAEGISNSISKGLSDSYGTNQSKSLSLGTTESTGRTKGHSEGINFGKAISEALTMGASLGGNIGLGFEILNFGLNLAGNISKGRSNATSTGVNASIQSSRTSTTGSSKTESTTTGTNEQQTTTKTEMEAKTTTDTGGTSLQIEYLSKSVKQLLDRIDIQLDRIRECENFGVFSVASYFIAGNMGYSSMAASTYKSIISGDRTSVETSGIASWQDDKKVAVIKEYLKRLYHPVFKLYSGEIENDVTAVSLVSGKELSIHLGMPKKSVPGVVVSECASFGRNLYMLSGENNAKTIEIGNIYHMCADEDTKVNLKVHDLSMHTFITGATGSGKSNAVYQILKRLDEEDIKFLVIEPAKGEYKHIFGNRKDVEVYGTNPKKNKLLRINPFSFPNDIHVLEHIDKLVEIFNVCWPMYAAMPAVLKEAVEKAYVFAGWNLDESVNMNGENIFPTFHDVLIRLTEVINASAFSDEVKSNYSGALLTRVKSLTNGINGRVFSGDELEVRELFDENVIVDISRVGSMDTKSLIMGVLVMKLQEYRMAVGGMNQPLKHVTVLEEAHNLLKSSAVSGTASEGADLIGKSVEMLSNIIAEVRTYGEGFIIADQAPGLLDASVIRNTNTKIILRLPDYEDRKLVGKSANLSDNQLNELAKLPVGVAAVYHNDWIEPVLCHFEKFDTKGRYGDTVDTGSAYSKSDLLKYLVDSHAGREAIDRVDDVDKLVMAAPIQSELKIKLLAAVKTKNKIDDELFKKCVCSLYDQDAAFVAAMGAQDIEEWNNMLVRNLDLTLCSMDMEYQNIVVKLLLEQRAKSDLYFEDMNIKWNNFMDMSDDGRRW